MISVGACLQLVPVAGGELNDIILYVQLYNWELVTCRSSRHRNFQHWQTLVQVCQYYKSATGIQRGGRLEVKDTAGSTKLIAEGKCNARTARG